MLRRTRPVRHARPTRRPRVLGPALARAARARGRVSIRASCLLLGALLAFSLTGCGSVQAPAAQDGADAGCAELVMTGHPAYAPVVWADGEELAGAGPEAIAEIAEGLELPLRSRSFGVWQDNQDAVKAGDADLILGVYFNEERAAFLDYLEPPILMDPTAIFARAGESFPYASREDLQGRVGVTDEGESFGTDWDAYLAEELEVLRTDSIEAAFRALVDGEADYMIFGLYPGLAELARLGLADAVELVDGDIVSQGMYAAIHKDSACNAPYREALAEGLAAMQSDGRLDALLQASMPPGAGE